MNILFTVGMVQAFATDLPDGAPVMGSFVHDDNYAAEIATKEALARAYDNALKTNNLTLAKNILNKINACTNNIQTNLKNGSLALFPNNIRLAIYQVPQERNYWCGYAAMKSLLDFEGIVKTQLEIAKQTYKENDALAWYTIDGSDKSQFPAAVKLQELTGYNYTPYPYGQAGATNIKASDIEYRIKCTIDAGHGVLICGHSRGNIENHDSILPGYPALNIGHWIVANGYINYDDPVSPVANSYSKNNAEIWIVDPAKSSVIKWSGSINAYYKVTTINLAAFAKSRGIIW